MLLWLLHYLQPYWHVLRVFDYLTFRSIVSALTAFSISLYLGPKLINFLQSFNIGQAVREDGPRSHLKKSGTPTMGGVIILIAITASILLWGDLNNQYLLLVLITTLCFGLIGGVDDYRKVTQGSSRGLPARWKFFWQSVVAIAVVLFLVFGLNAQGQTQLVIPFLKNVMPNLGWFFIVFAFLVIVGTSNAVNLTDGLDGLALMPTVLVTMAFAVFAYVAGNHFFAKYLSVPYVAGVGELVVYCSALVGAGLGFLWYNTYPAQIFMGDVGSLSLGASLGVIAVLVRQELVLFIMGGIFVLETLSVILQVGSFKLRGKRIFKMAPIHHHFELKGWAEPKVIVRFWIITVILILLGLATLKLR